MLNAIFVCLALGAAPDGVSGAELTLSSVTYTATWNDTDGVYDLDNGYGSYFIVVENVWHWDEDGVGAAAPRSIDLPGDRHPFWTGSPFWESEWSGVHEFGAGFVEGGPEGWTFGGGGYGGETSGGGFTTEQAAEVVELLEDVRFFAYVVAIASGFGVGLMLWRLLILAKNQGHLW